MRLYTIRLIATLALVLLTAPLTTEAQQATTVYRIGRLSPGSPLFVADLLETLANRPGFAVHVHPGQHDAFEVSAVDTRGLLSLVLRRQRERSGLSLADAAVRLGAKSRNAYARYERGTAVPTLDKLTELLQAVAPGQDFVLQQSMVG